MEGSSFTGKKVSQHSLQSGLLMTNKHHRYCHKVKTTYTKGEQGHVWWLTKGHW